MSCRDLLLLPTSRRLAPQHSSILCASSSCVAAWRLWHVFPWYRLAANFGQGWAGGAGKGGANMYDCASFGKHDHYRVPSLVQVAATRAMLCRHVPHGLFLNNVVLLTAAVSALAAPAQRCGTEHLTWCVPLCHDPVLQPACADSKIFSLCVLTVAPSTAGGCCSSQLC